MGKGMSEKDIKYQVIKLCFDKGIHIKYRQYRTNKQTNKKEQTITDKVLCYCLRYENKDIA